MGPLESFLRSINCYPEHDQLKKAKTSRVKPQQPASANAPNIKPLAVINNLNNPEQLRVLRPPAFIPEGGDEWEAGLSTARPTLGLTTQGNSLFCYLLLTLLSCIRHHFLFLRC